ncbi:diadenylate cyclase CdaA [Rapidithrix thailandica]|uniref:Diadenylate cyclase n=1 Tax=Rapidithrix thailandica TaxID=413964 RepID=A0AAW9S8G4_9BACT
MSLLFNIGFLEINFVDFLDILLVTILLFKLYKLIRGSVALKIFVGYLALYLLYLVVKATEMELLSSILGQFMGVGVLAAIILFQQEIRKFLLLIGKSTNFSELSMWHWFNNKNHHRNEWDPNPILEAMKSLGGTNMGALIVISKDDDLRFFVETGDLLDAQISKRLLLSVFYKNSPLHDGALIIHKGRIVAARCILPVSENQEIPATMGLRHRAAIGITEITNSVVLVVSEETGQMSFVRSGKIYHNLSSLEIRKLLREYFTGETETEKPEVKVTPSKELQTDEKQKATDQVESA